MIELTQSQENEHTPENDSCSSVTCSLLTVSIIIIIIIFKQHFEVNMPAKDKIRNRGSYIFQMSFQIQKFISEGASLMVLSWLSSDIIEWTS